MPEPAEEVGAAAPVAPPKKVAPSPRPVMSEKVVRAYSQYAAAAGLIPLPGVDLLAIGGLQLRMIAELATVYGVPFNEHVGKSLVAALVGGSATAPLALRAGSSLARSLPGLGTIAGLIAMPSCAYATTWAIGNMFAQHFANGGTLRDFDPKGFRRR